MELWTEYEGITIDGTFPLIKLLQPTGRSASFSTSSGAGVPTIIRLVECHSDDDKVLTRWRKVVTLDHPNILKLEDYGRVVMDETSVVYTVMEPVDANLGEFMSRHRLTVSETRKIARSLVAALNTLHAHGFFHGHVEAGNVLTVNKVIKLRSDCILEVPEGERGRNLQRRDVCDLAVLLLQILTQDQAMEAVMPSLSLPVPFDEIVRNGISGKWGLVEIAAALEAEIEVPENFHAVALPESEIAAALEPEAEMMDSSHAVVPPAAEAAPLQADSPPETPEAESKTEEGSPVTDIIRLPINMIRDAVPDKFREAVPGMRWTVAFQVVATVLLCLGWYFLQSRPASQIRRRAAQVARALNQNSLTHTPPAPAPAPVAHKRTTKSPTTSTTPAPAATTNAPAAVAIKETKPVTESTPQPVTAAPTKPVPANIPAEAAKAAPPALNSIVPGAHGQWRVIIYRYMSEEQAQHQAAKIAQKYPNLRPESFTPSGHAPYLVTIGGEMGRLQALDLVKEARMEGLPSDTYAYKSKYVVNKSKTVEKRHRRHMKHMQKKTA